MLQAISLNMLSGIQNGLINLGQFLSREENKTFTCSACGKTFDSQQRLDSHMNGAHSEQSGSATGVGWTKPSC